MKSAVALVAFGAVVTVVLWQNNGPNGMTMIWGNMTILCALMAAMGIKTEMVAQDRFSRLKKQYLKVTRLAHTPFPR
jgi:sorbitol-specific phosphotransferase system component IIC